MIQDLGAIARALGGEVSKGQALCPGPGHSRKDRSLVIKLSAASPDGFLAHSHAGDDWRACRDHVRERLGLPGGAWKRGRSASHKPRPKPVQPAAEPDDAERIASAMSLWRASADPRGTHVERYLNSRKLELSADLAGEVIRWHPGIGAMIALFRNITTGQPQAVSRTFLDQDAHKVERKFLGPVGGAAVMLDPFDAVTTGLHIGEGIESCMSARALGLRPCWATGSAGAIAGFPVLGGIDCLTILAEPDAESQVEQCAERWDAAGREVFINEPTSGSDLNDALKEIKHG